MNGEAFGRTIQLFLVDGKPTGLRKATIHGWTGLLFVSGASAFGDLTARDEVDRTGVYILSGPDPESAGVTRVYIGSGNSVAERIKQSALKREFWETAITVTTSDDDLSKGHAEYLEARLIQLAGAAGRVSLDNATQPDFQRRRLPEADVANMEQFLANLRIILPVIGLDMLKPQPKAVVEASRSIEERTTGEVQFELRHTTIDVHALAVQEDGEFVVLEGSQALADMNFASNNYARLKARLIEDGVLSATPLTGGQATPHRLWFVKPWSFSSPSAAGSVILDRNTNGRTRWVVKGTRQTYHDWQQSQAAKQETDQ
ncbi:GIY-YIG nuclease family protein [Pararhodobacter sp. CCB-MM2]|uniref:GIY-YIG nuclease family protein n=1 Tax=Pararhodobacter sp. CCB-MM2 TaxID=1786003 RepID=UPI0008338925|nr:GIY-YIG nuclease family protein [Pararhodobacter sp. CCB-MM2]